MTKQSTILMTISVGIISLTSFFIFFLILTNYIWLYPRSLNYPISCSWTYKQCKAWLPSHSMDLKSDQTLVGHSHKWHATIAPTHLTVFITVHQTQEPQQILQTLNLIKEKVSNNLEHIGTGSYFLNRTQIV